MTDRCALRLHRQICQTHPSEQCQATTLQESCSGCSGLFSTAAAEKLIGGGPQVLADRCSHGQVRYRRPEGPFRTSDAQVLRRSSPVTRSALAPAYSHPHQHPTEISTYTCTERVFQRILELLAKPCRVFRGYSHPHIVVVKKTRLAHDGLHRSNQLSGLLFLILIHAEELLAGACLGILEKFSS